LGEGKSDLSTRRSVPMADLVADALRDWRERTEYSSPDDLVFRADRRLQGAATEHGLPVISPD
jgi:hypothetical protein